MINRQPRLSRPSFSRAVEKTVKDIHDLMEDMLDLSSPDERANWYYRGDTGTGKTTAILWHVAMITAARFAIAAPTRKAADQLYAQLQSWGVDVAVWTQAHDLRNPQISDFEPSGRFFKDQLAQHRVIVGTHNFLLSSNSNLEKYIGKRDLLIVDEVPSHFDGAEEVRLSQFTRAWEEAHALELNAKAPLYRAKKWAEEIVRAEECVRQYEKPKLSEERPEEWLQLASCLDSKGMTDEGKSAIAAVLNFVLASFEGRAFVQNRDSSGRRRVVFYTTKMHLPSIKRTLYVSATVHLEGWQVSPYCDQVSESRGQDIDYRNLTIIADGWPAHLPTKYGDLLAKPKARDDYKRWVVEMVLKTPKDSKTLLVVPARLVDDTRAAFRDKSLLFGEHGLNVRVTHFKTDVGSNEYRDCTDVILVGLHHAPKTAHIQRGFQFSQASVSQETLDKQSGRLVGIFREVQYGDYKAQIKQLGARGHVRVTNPDGSCGRMRLWTYQNSVLPQELAELFPGANMDIQPGAVRQNSGVGKSRKDMTEEVYHGLKMVSSNKIEITVPEMAQLIDSPSLVTKGSRLAAREDAWGLAGWRFVPGTRGRKGQPAKFVRLDVPPAKLAA